MGLSMASAIQYPLDFLLLSPDNCSHYDLMMMKFSFFIWAIFKLGCTHGISEPHPWVPAGHFPIAILSKPLTQINILIKNIYCYYYYCCVHVCLCALPYICGVQRTALWSWSSPSTCLWVLGFEFGLLSLCAAGVPELSFWPLSCLAGLQNVNLPLWKPPPHFLSPWMMPTSILAPEHEPPKACMTPHKTSVPCFTSMPLLLCFF